MRFSFCVKNRKAIRKMIRVPVAIDDVKEPHCVIPSKHLSAKADSIGKASSGHTETKDFTVVGGVFCAGKG
jgi:hypothetical protein